ncbi:MAG: hypothetical protein ACFB2X_08355 [Rivularia sp. (in: cyanobacteria)]
MNPNNPVRKNPMRVKYLATLATVSVLSLGVVVGCANPCAGKTPEGGTTEVNPCASKGENPCAAKDKNPCAAKDKE